MASESATNVYATPSKQTPIAQAQHGFDSEMRGEEAKSQHLQTAPALMEGSQPLVVGQLPQVSPNTELMVNAT